MGEKLPISVCITTKNNEETIERCLDSVSHWTDEIIVIDSNSTDQTRPICKKYGAKIFDREFSGFSELKMEAVQQATNQWVLILDADEEIPKNLKEEIIDRWQDGGQVAFYIKKKNKMFGKWMNIYHPRRPLLARKDVIFYKNEFVWEELSVKGQYKKNTSNLQNPIRHYAYDRVSEKLDKMDQYTSLAAIQHKESEGKDRFGPFLIKSLLTIPYILIIRRGILDGSRGILFSILESAHFIITYVKIQDIKRLEEKEGDNWKQIWIREECQRD